MGDAEAETVGNPGRMVLPSLVISRFATMPPGFLTRLLLIDIGESFGQAVGVTGQIRTAASIVGVLSALLISALSLRFRPKSLLVGGLGILVASTVGCALAPSFTVLLAVYALTGMAGSLVGPMAFTLVAEHFPPRAEDKRPQLDHRRYVCRQPDRGPDNRIPLRLRGLERVFPLVRASRLPVWIIPGCQVRAV